MFFNFNDLPSRAVLMIKKEDLEQFAAKLLEQVTIAKEDDTGEILTIEEAATFLNLAKQTLYGYTHKRAIPFYKRNKRLYFKKSELVAWLEKGQQPTVEEEEEEVLDYLRSNQSRRNK